MRLTIVFLTNAILFAATPSIAETKRQGLNTPPKVKTIPKFLPEAFGSWIVDTSGSGFGAWTTNKTNSVFGLYCSNGCVSYFNLGTSCEDNHTYPGLIGSSAGSFNVAFKCVTLDERNLLTFSLTSELVDVFETSGELGVVIPLKSGEFQVSRFSLKGSLKASRRAYELSGSATRDEGKTDKRLTDCHL